MKKTFDIKSMSCANCALKIEDAFKKIEGVKVVSLDFAREKVVIEGEVQSLDAEVLQKIAQTIEKEVKVYDIGDDRPIIEDTPYMTKKEMLLYGIAVILMGIAFVLDRGYLLNVSLWIYLPIYLVAYVIFGWQVLYKAFSNMRYLKFFDENFLMTIATLGALLIGEYVEAIAVMLFYRIGEHLQNKTVSDSRKSIKALVEIQPTIAHQLTKEGIIDVTPESLLVGQLILIRPGEKVPVDGIITEGSSWLDTSSLTGESLPRDAYQGIEVISGSINISGLITVQVQKRYEDSTVAKILEFVEHNQAKKAETEKFMTRFARYYTPIVVILAVLLATVVPLVISWFSYETFAELVPIYFERSLIFLVISCPCALVLSIPLSFFAGIGSASKKGILFKSGSDLEMLSQVDHFVFDKTGTLTKGEFKLSSIVSGEPELILEYAAHAEYHSTHPIALSIMKAYDKKIDPHHVHSIREVAGKGVIANYKGIHLLVGNHKLLDDHQIKYMKTHEIGTIVYVVANKEYLGYLVIKDQIKDTSKELIKGLHKLNKKVTMVTGDYQTQAMDVAFHLGIEDYYANCLPEDKVHIVEAISSKYITAFIGDGMNDAPVLTTASIGIAMGGIGSDAAIEASDAVIMNDDPKQILTAFKISKKTMVVVMQNIILALGIKIVVLVLGAMGYANMWLAIFADVGVSILAVFNAARIFKTKPLLKKHKI